MKMNPVSWFEICVNDFDRAKKFYETVFNVKLTEFPTPVNDNSRMANFPMQDGLPGAMGCITTAPSMPEIKPGISSVLIFFETEDCLTEQNRIEQAGGKVLQPKYSIGENGFVALCSDSEGNRFGLHSMN